MKIAFLAYGEFRTADVATKTWNFLEKYQTDFFVHTLDTSYDYKKTKDSFQKIVKSDINNLIPNAKIWMEDRNNYKIENEYNDIHMNFRSFRFLYKKLLEVKTKYDFIIVNRLDTLCYIASPEYFFKNYNKKSVYILKNNLSKDNTFLQDHFFMGSADVILKLLKNLPNAENLKRSHTDFGRFLLNNFHLNYTPVLCNHLRASQIELVENYINSNLLESAAKNKDNGEFNKKIALLEKKEKL